MWTYTTHFFRIVEQTFIVCCVKYCCVFYQYTKTSFLPPMTVRKFKKKNWLSNKFYLNNFFKCHLNCDKRLNKTLTNTTFTIYPVLKYLLVMPAVWDYITDKYYSSFIVKLKKNPVLNLLFVNQHLHAKLCSNDPSCPVLLSISFSKFQFFQI